MFILDINIENATRLVRALFYDFTDPDGKKEKLKTAKPDKDKYVVKDEKTADLKSDKSLFLLLLGFVFNNKSQKQKQLFENHLAALEKSLPKNSDLDDAKSEKIAQYLSGTLAEYANLFKEDTKEEAARARGKSALGSVTAAHPMTALKSLIKIAKNSDFPADIRAFAMALVNDALSHMKDQEVDNKSAQILVKLLNNTPPQVRDVLFGALKDAKKIEEASKKKASKDVLSVYDYASQKNRKIVTA